LDILMDISRPTPSIAKHPTILEQTFCRTYTTPISNKIDFFSRPRVEQISETND